MLGADDDRPGQAEVAEGGEGAQSERARPDDGDDGAGDVAGRQRPVDGAGRRFDHDGRLVGDGFGYGVELRDVGDQGGAPPAAGVGAVAGLEPGGEVAVDLTPLWQREIQLVGAYAYGSETSLGRRTFDVAMELVHDAGLHRLVTARYPLERYVEAIEHAANAGRRGAVKIAFDQRRPLRGRRAAGEQSATAKS